MEKSQIYDLIDSGLLRKWKDEIEGESGTQHFLRVQETSDELEKELNEQEKRLLKSYSLAIENKLDYIYYRLKIRILNLGIKIGMELERSFTEYKE